MKIAELVELLRSRIQNQRLSLIGSDFPGAQVQTYLLTCLGTDTLSLDQPDLHTDEEQVTLNGQLILPGDHNPPALCRFWCEAEIIHISIELVPTPLSIPSGLASFSQFLSRLVSPEMTGIWLPDSQNPQLEWRAPAVTRIALGTIQADVGIILVQSIREGKIGCRLWIEAQTGGQIIRMESDSFTENPGYLLFSSQEDLAIDPMALLTDLVEAADLPFLPPEFHPQSGLLLNRLECIMGMQSGSIVSFQIELALSRRLTIIPQKLELNIEKLVVLANNSPSTAEVSATVVGKIDIGDLTLSAEVLLPDTSLRVSLEPDAAIPVSHVLGAILPLPDLSTLDLISVKGEVDWKHKAYSLEVLLKSDSKPNFLQHFPDLESRSRIFIAGDAENTTAFIGTDLAVGSTEIALGMKLAAETEIVGTISQLSLKEVATQLLNTNLSGLPDVNLLEGKLNLTTGGALKLSGKLEVDFVELCADWKIPFPDSLNSVTLQSLSVAGEMATKDFNFTLLTNERIPLLKGSGGQVELTAGRVEIQNSSAVKAFITLNGTTQIADQVSLFFEEVTISYDSTSGKWGTTATAKLSLYGQVHLLSIDLGNDHLRLSYKGKLVLSHLGGRGEVAIDQLALFVERKEQDGKPTTRWGIGGKAHITHQGPDGKSWLSVVGSLEIESGTKGKKLSILADAPKIPPIPLDVGGIFPHAPSLQFGLDNFGFEYESKEGEEAQWTLTAGARLQILNIPSLFEKYLPAEELEGYFRSNQKGTQLGFSVPELLQPTFPRLVLSFADDRKLDLGQPGLHIDAIEVDMTQKPKLTTNFEVQLPSGMNLLFGQENGQPKKTLFNSSFILSLELAKQVKMRTLSSPLVPLEYFEKEKDLGAKWTRWDLGEAGVFDFRVPEFSYSGNRWEASGGFQRIGESQIPLTPIINLLRISGVPEAILSLIPTGIPLVDIDFRDGSFGDQLNQLFGDALKHASPAVKEGLELVIDTLKKAITTLPYALQEYFKVKIPRSLLMEMKVDAIGGGSSGGLRILREGEGDIEAATPLSVLIPTGMDLIGLTLRGFSFGQKAGGSMILIEIDGHIDRFNLLELAVAIPLGKQDILNRLTFSNTRLLLPAGMPVPIPLFYDEIAVDYIDVLGTEFQTHWRNPDPDWGLENYLGVFSALFSFITDKEYLFSQTGFNEVLNTRLGIGIQRMRMPTFLGGAEIVLNMLEVELDTGQLIGGVFDFFKTGNAAYAIQAVPLKANDSHWIRVGAIVLEFGPFLEISANWCITTQQEFQEDVLPAIARLPELAPALDQEVLTILPEEVEEGAAYSKGFIILMGGKVDFGGILGLQAQFGLALTGKGESRDDYSGAFETGFLLAGSIANALTLKIGGKVLVENSSETGTSIEIDGAIQLLWKETNLIETKGRIAVNRERFEVEIILSLSDHFSIGGRLEIGKERFLLKGTVKWGHDGSDNVYLASLQIDGNGMTIGFDWIYHGLTGKVRIQTPGGSGSLYRARVELYPSPELMGQIKASIQQAADNIAGSSVDDAYKGMQQAIADFEGSEISVNGLRESLPPLCRNIINTINRTIDRNTTGIKKVARGFAKRKAQPFINRVNKVAHIAENSPESTFRDDLKAALQDILKNNSIKISYSIGKGWFRKTFSIYSGAPITGENKENLKLAIRHIDKLQESSSLRAKHSGDYAQFPDRDQLLAEIHNSVGAAIPEVEYIEFEVELGVLIPKGVKVSASYTFNGQVRTVGGISLDFNNPGQMAKALADSFT